MPGARQKRARIEAAAARPIVHSMLAGLLIRMVTKGELQAKTIQVLSDAARVDIEAAMRGEDTIHLCWAIVLNGDMPFEPHYWRAWFSHESIYMFPHRPNPTTHMSTRTALHGHTCTSHK